MQARDSAGRRVSLLNDEPIYRRPSSSNRPSYRATRDTVSQPYPVMRRESASPNTPELLRCDSYDSNASSDPISPLTPTVAYVFSSAPPIYDDYEPEHASRSSKRPAYADRRLSSSYEGDVSGIPLASDRSGKRYPCRYRDSHGCEKTFTTSGHASRHSKIHTAEKAVHCTFDGCSKKFTRADNMKQHLETHFKDKSRSSGSHRSSRTLATGGTSNRKHSRTSGSRDSTSSHDRGTWESDQYSLPTPTGQASLPSPGTSSGAWDLRGLHGPLLSRPSAARTPSSGLDALTLAIAYQEEEDS